MPDDAGLVIPGMVDDVALITGGDSGGEKGYGRNRPHHSHPNFDTYEGDFVQGTFGQTLYKTYATLYRVRGVLEQPIPTKA